MADNKTFRDHRRTREDVNRVSGRGAPFGEARRSAFPFSALPRNVRKQKLSSRSVVRALKRWLLRDKITYEQARARLLKQFGISVSMSRICAFWQRNCQRVTKLPASQNPVLLDVVLQASKPVRVQILQSRVRFIQRVKRAP